MNQQRFALAILIRADLTVDIATFARTLRAPIEAIDAHPHVSKITGLISAKSILTDAVCTSIQTLEDSVGVLLDANHEFRPPGLAGLRLVSAQSNGK
ncbi:hypothetical protein Plhal304r1_c003g0013531 [Plasmopara halstedii]